MLLGLVSLPPLRALLLEENICENLGHVLSLVPIVNICDKCNQTCAERKAIFVET